MKKNKNLIKNFKNTKNNLLDHKRMMKLTWNLRCVTSLQRFSQIKVDWFQLSDFVSELERKKKDHVNVTIRNRQALWNIVTFKIPFPNFHMNLGC